MVRSKTEMSKAIEQAAPKVAEESRELQAMLRALPRLMATDPKGAVQATRELAERARLVADLVILNACDTASYAEIGESLGVSRQAVHHRVDVCLQQLSNTADSKGPDLPSFGP